MRVWLAASGLLFLGWTTVLFTSPQILVSPEHAVSHALVVALVAAAKFVLGLLALWSASNPKVRRLGIYTTILALLINCIVDTYGVLVVLPPNQAALVLADLILSVALVVGVLEALPRTLGVVGVVKM